jgi:hypothetical protein
MAPPHKDENRPPRRGNGKPVRSGDDRSKGAHGAKASMGRPHKVTKNHAFSAKNFKRGEIGGGATIKSSAKPKKKGKSGVYRSGFTARPTLLINLDAIKDNYNALQEHVGNVKIGASVKADAYGLGASTVSKTLYGAGCRTFFVATAGEGKMVREAIGENASIYVLNGPAPRPYYEPPRLRARREARNECRAARAFPQSLSTLPSSAA